MPTGAIIYALGANVRSRESLFADTTENAGMLAVQAGSNTVFQSQDCQFIGWIGSNVVSACTRRCFSPEMAASLPEDKDKEGRSRAGTTSACSKKLPQ